MDRPACGGRIAPSQASAASVPRIFDRFRAGISVAGALDGLGDVEPGEPAFQGVIERAVVDLLEP